VMFRSSFIWSSGRPHPHDMHMVALHSIGSGSRTRRAGSRNLARSPC
jgi:hypothetical protein